MTRLITSDEARLAENRELRAQLAEARQTLEAIRSDGVDALVVSVDGQERIFTLKGADQSYQNLIEAMQQGALIVNKGGVILYANRSFASMLKAPLEKVIGSALSSWIAPQVQPVLTSLLNLKVGARKESEILMTDTECMLVPVLLSVGKTVPSRESDHLWMVLTDLTEITARKKKEVAALAQKLTNDAQLVIDRKLAAAALTRANYTRSLIEASLDPLVTINAEGEITDVNKASIEITGRAREQLIGTDFSDYFTEPDKAHQGYEQVFQNGFVRDYPLTIRHSDGHCTEVLYNASLYRDEEEQVQGVFAAARDISEIRKAELAISRLSSIVEFSDDAIIGLDPDDIITSWNHGAELIFGYSALEMLGTSLLRVIPPELHPQELEVASMIRRGAPVRHFESVHLVMGGRRIAVSVTASPIKNSDGHVVGSSRVTRDITERKQAQIEILSLNAALEDRVKERTAELEASNHELESFSYSVSHDLRAPLRAIDGFSRIVEEDYAPKLDEEGRRVIGVIRGEAKRMGRLIDDLLAFSRLGRQKVEPTTIDMGTMARQVFDELIAQEPQRTIHLKLHPIPAAFGTEAMIRQLWTNLIGNAVKFTGKRKSAEIEIGVQQSRSEKQEEAVEQIYFVRDNGAGFDMRYADKLFGVFQRLHSSEEFPGTGVGLALVQRIIHRHGGRVWGEGEVEKGSTFYFTIPDQRKETSKLAQAATKLSPDISPNQTS
jgi:PAS domain S-box-containing protein